ncbi:MAG: nuclear transport factor 2 family protein, partial [Acidimicrobiia bacterium]
METIKDTDREVGTDKETKKPSRGPTVLIVVLAVALVGLVAWMVFMMRPNSPTAASPEIVQLMEDYTAAWNAQDADALEAVVTDEYRIYGPATSGFDHDMESIRSYLFPLLDGMNWQVSNNGNYYAVNTSGYTWAVTNEGATITRGGVEYEQNGVMT